MRIFQWIEKLLRSVLPSPFTIAVLLTVFVAILAFVFGNSESDWQGIARFWQKGMWDPSMLVFAVQMMLMLVLGHVLALTNFVDLIIRRATLYCNNTANAAFLVTFFTVLMAFFNWGLGLIFGAVFARKVGEHAQRNGIWLNYGLIGAAGYSGLMVWHGGISGSAPIKVAEDGHLNTLMAPTLDAEKLMLLPKSIPLSETVFSSMNISASLALIVCLPLLMYWLGRRFPGTSPVTLKSLGRSDSNSDLVVGAERLDHIPWFSKILGLLILLVALLQISDQEWRELSFITPNFLNLFLLGAALFFHKNNFSFLKAVDDAIGGASGILIQFPLYFGIMGIMSHSGLIDFFSDIFMSVSSPDTFPITSFFSAGLVNLFVPSGGGQWGVQGPILISAAMEMGVSFPKAIMALAYGDQLTNMLQPFWALPLLGITGLSARSILPYSVMIMLVGFLIFGSVLILF